MQAAGLPELPFNLALCEKKWGFRDCSMVKNPPAISEATGDAGLIPGLGRSPEEMLKW